MLHIYCCPIQLLFEGCQRLYSRAISSLIVYLVRHVNSGLSLFLTTVSLDVHQETGAWVGTLGLLTDITWVSSWCLHFNGSSQGVDLDCGGYRKPLKQNEELNNLHASVRWTPNMLCMLNYLDVWHAFAGSLLCFSIRMILLMQEVNVPDWTESPCLSLIGWQDYEGPLS